MESDASRPDLPTDPQTDLPGPALPAEAQLALKRFLRESLYRHPRVRRMTQQAGEIVAGLFHAFCADYERMPKEHCERARRCRERSGEAAGARVVADYIAGMTDRFAMQAHEDLATRR